MNATRRPQSDDAKAPHSVVNTLTKLGWKLLSSDQADRQRARDASNALLEDILSQQLHSINSFDYKEKVYSFSQSTIQSAIAALRTTADEGLVQTNKHVYDLLTLGKSFVESVQGDQKAFTLRYIDWESPERNAYHLVENFVVTGLQGACAPHLVLFVNGIPFVVIERASRYETKEGQTAVAQHLRNQQKEVGIPRLYHYAQLLVAVDGDQVKYAVTGAAETFWSVWKEDNVQRVQRLLATKAGTVPTAVKPPTPVDCSLVSLCEKRRLIELIYGFVVFAGAEKKLARYQQYFAVKEAMRRIGHVSKKGTRRGGLIWHTQGSGKSLTMVMLSKSLALNVHNARVLIVTDRVDLDKQLFNTFHTCGKVVVKAGSGNHLIDLLKDPANEHITTVIDKFYTALRRNDFRDESRNLFVLVDESHRSQYGVAHRRMKRMLPNACYIGFTGTPLIKAEKNTARTFGGIIHAYTVEQAVRDKAVLPLLYEGRHPSLRVSAGSLDSDFDQLTSSLEAQDVEKIKKGLATYNKVYGSAGVVHEIAVDVARHFCAHWKGTGLKGQLVVPRIDIAVKYQRSFEIQTDTALKVNTRIVITPPGTHGEAEGWDYAGNETMHYWRQLMERYGDQQTYEDRTLEQFRSPSNEVEILIVVNKLLVGFDVPRNTILYLAKPLTGHNLLQAIARVNRLFPGKAFGHVIDYVGMLGKLDEALTSYAALAEFDPDDVAGVVYDARDVVGDLTTKIESVWHAIGEVDNRRDQEVLQRRLADKGRRMVFHAALKQLFEAMQVAASTASVSKQYTDTKWAELTEGVRQFYMLQKAVVRRYAESKMDTVYEPRVQKLLDQYVSVDSIEIMESRINIFEDMALREAKEPYLRSPASQADYIAHSMQRVLIVNRERDEALYTKFSKVIQDHIDAFERGQLHEKEYLESVLALQKEMSDTKGEQLPAPVRDNVEAAAFYKAIVAANNDRIIAPTPDERTVWASMSVQIAAIVKGLAIRDWNKNADVQLDIENAIEDFLLASRQRWGLNITYEQVDGILKQCMLVSRRFY